jgi:hypothetical protein
VVTHVNSLWRRGSIGEHRGLRVAHYAEVILARFIVIVAIAIFSLSCVFAQGQNAPESVRSAANTEFSAPNSIEALLNQEINADFSAEQSKFLWASGLSTVIFDVSRSFYFIAPKSGAYSIQYQSDDKMLGSAIIDENGKILNVTTIFPVPPLVTRIPIPLKSGQKIWIVAGFRTIGQPEHFRFGVFDKGSNGI